MIIFFRTFIEQPRLLKHLTAARGVFNMTSLWCSSEITTARWPICYTTIKKKTNIIDYITYTVAMNVVRIEVISRFAKGRKKEGFYVDGKW